MKTVTSNLIQTPKVVTIDQNRWSRSVTFTGHDLLEWVVTVDQNTHNGNEHARQDIPYTDFPIDEISIYACWDGEHWVLMLPSEY